jgi:hypothetical protein
MAYKKTDWKTRLGEGLTRFKIKSLTDTHIDIVSDPINITQEGVPVTVERLNNIEDGIVSLDDAVDVLKDEVNKRTDLNHTHTGGAGDAPQIAAGGLAANAVETVKIKDKNVTEAKLADSAVSAVKIAANAVETAKIKDANVTAAKLATDAVETAKIKDKNVTQAKIADITADATSAKAVFSATAVTFANFIKTVWQGITWLNRMVDKGITYCNDPQWSGWSFGSGGGSAKIENGIMKINGLAYSHSPTIYLKAGEALIIRARWTGTTQPKPLSTKHSLTASADPGPNPIRGMTKEWQFLTATITDLSLPFEGLYVNDRAAGDGYEISDVYIGNIFGMEGIIHNINAKAPLASPALTGTPTAPTAAAKNNSTQIATTAYADRAGHPVGSWYTQYPESGQSAIDGMFPSSKSPATLFGGTWTERFASEDVFFRTGALGTNRGKQWNSTTKAYETGTTGIEPDAVRSISGRLPLSREAGFTGSIAAGCFKPADEILGCPVSLIYGNAKVPGSNYVPQGIDLYFSSGFETPTDYTNHPKNRLIKVWERTA